MHGLTLLSILFLLFGATILSLGIWLYWTTNPISGWAGTNVTLGVLLLLGAIVFLSIGLYYEQPVVHNIIHHQ